MKVFDYSFLKQTVGKYVEAKSPALFALLNKHKTGVKYMFAGGTAAMVYLAILYVLTDFLGIWYLTSSIFAFLVSLLTSFFLQKFWTFRDSDLGRLKKQMIIYAAMGALNFILNPVLLHTFVERFHLWYILAAVLVMGSLAIANYLTNKFITFRKRKIHESFNV